MVYSRSMNKKLLLAALTIVIVIGAAMAYVLLQRDTNSPPADAPQANSEAQPNPQVEPTVSKGTYIGYADNTFASVQGTRLLFFHAPWCPQCRALDESIKTSDLPEGVTIFKVDYDSNQALRAKYGVTLQTTVVKVDEKGDKLSSYVAYDEPTFQSVKQALLP